jgi:peptidoglycan/LPS O-acetylase OafA/YrhL
MPYWKTQAPRLAQFSQRLRSRWVPGSTTLHDSAPMQVSLGSIDQELRQVLSTKVISGLDALRALAVGLVLIDHFLFTDHLLGVHPKTGSLGVMIFFVLSGFLITAMLLKEYRKTGGISLGNFYRRRAYRIFPTFYCCWILTTVVDFLAHQLQWKTAAISFFYLMDYGRALAPENVQPWMHMWISWSLAVEEKFYLLWPLLLLFLLKRPTLIRILVSIILGQWTYRAILFLGLHVSESYVYCAFDMRADALLVGCLLAILLEKDSTRLLCCRALRWQWLSLLAPLALAWVVMAPPSNQAAGLLVWSLEPVVIAVMLLQVVYWGAKSWTLCSRGIVRITAHLSYALYLYHPLAGKIVKLLGLRHLGLYAVGLLLLMATASYYLVERPFMRMRDSHRETAANPVRTVQPVA